MMIFFTLDDTLKHRRFRRLLPWEQRFLFVVVCLFVCFFSYKVLRVACHQLLVFCQSPRERLRKCYGITAWRGRGWLTSDHFLLQRLHELPFSSCPLLLHANRNIVEHVRLLPVDFCWHFSFHHAIQFYPVERIATRSMPHSIRLVYV